MCNSESGAEKPVIFFYRNVEQKLTVLEKECLRGESTRPSISVQLSGKIERTAHDTITKCINQLQNVSILNTTSWIEE